MFAPDHWLSRRFLLDHLRIACNWNPFAEFDRHAEGWNGPTFDLVIANTFPSPGGQQTVERALSVGGAVLGLVHDISFFERSGGAHAALARHRNLWLAYAGVAPPDAACRLPIGIRQRVSRFVPVLRFDPLQGTQVARRTGVALPGALEYRRRDFSTALRLTAETGVPLRIFGRSCDHGDGPKVPRDLDAERRRLFGEIDARGVAASVMIAMDVSCQAFYRAVAESQFVAVLPASPEYLMGKLTGAVTAAVSCGVPMLAPPRVRDYYTLDDSDLFSGCMLAFDAFAPAGRGDDWGSLVRDMATGHYEDPCPSCLDRCGFGCAPARADHGGHGRTGDGALRRERHDTGRRRISRHDADGGG